ncbi:MAG: hypothetical protein K0S71_659 [Clostridia bacterium]|jgi:excisionase family DNA binding protein|nr:hypothetical protein [Clostridia bacterium]
MSNVIKDLTEKVLEHKKEIEKKTFTAKEVSQVLGISENKVRQLLRAKNGIPNIKIGSRILVPITRFEEWLNNSIGQEF